MAGGTNNPASNAPSGATAGDQKVWGVVAEFSGPGPLLRAAEIVRDAGYKKWDAHAPFPVHGMEEAMGTGPSRVGWIVGAGALLGAGGAYLLQWWTTAVDYPVIVSGKPPAAWEPFTPVTFELGVLLAGFSALFGMFALNRLPRWFHPLFTKDRFLRASDDAFFIAIEARDSKFNPEATRRLLEEAGGYNIETVEEE